MIFYFNLFQLYIIEDDLKLKLEIQDIKKQFLLLLQDFRDFDGHFDVEDEHDTMFHIPDVPSSPESRSLIQFDDPGSSGEKLYSQENKLYSQDQKDLQPQTSVGDLSGSCPESNNSSFLSDIHTLPDASIEDRCIQKYFGGNPANVLPERQQDVKSGGTCLNEDSSSLPNSNRSSYGDLTAPNQTAASESTSNWDNVYINNLSKQEEVEEVRYQTRGAKPKKLKVYIQNIPWDNSSDSSYNKPYPDYKPDLHPELKKSIAQHNTKSISSMDSSLANLSDITKYSEMSSRWVNSQTDASDYNSCSPEDLPHQSTPTSSKNSENRQQQQIRMGSAYHRRGSPTGCTTDSDNNNHLVTPVGKIPCSEVCSSMDDSTPIVIPRTRRHLFPGEDSGITGSASDYTSSPSTMRENFNNNNTPGVIKMDRDMFLLMDENRTFNCKVPSSPMSNAVNQFQHCNNEIDMSLEVTRDSEANVAEITAQTDDNATSSSSNLSPLTTCTTSSYKESDGKSSPYPDSIDMALRTTIDGEEGYNQVIANLKTATSVKADGALPVKSSSSSSTSSRPPCIGKEATPENKLQSASHSLVSSMSSPPPQRDLMTALSQVGTDNGGELPVCKPPLPGYEELKKRATAPPARPTFTSYDGSDAAMPTVSEDMEEGNDAKGVINVDQYSKSPKDGNKKKTFLKKLKGIRKHFRSNSRSKAYVKNE